MTLAATAASAVPPPPMAGRSEPELPPPSFRLEAAERELPDSPLTRAARLRFPDVRSDTPPREKIARLEDYLYEVALVEGDVHELRLFCQRKLRETESAWDGVPGWRDHLRRPSGVPSAAERDAAKAQVRPDLWQLRDEAQWVVTRCNEALEFIERETKRTSRAYTLITGS